MLRIVHGRLDESAGGRLADYNLEVFAGEILYIQGMDGSGIRTLARVLAGDAVLEEGSLYLYGRQVVGYSRSQAQQYKIYAITSGQELVENLSIADNLEGIRQITMPLRPYLRIKAEKKAGELLRKAGIEAAADDEVWKLGQRERLKLSILKAQLYGAQLVILDATHGRFSGREGEELCDLIRQMNVEGVTFIILARHYEPFAEIASRLQLMADGMDVKEWKTISTRVRERLLNPEMSAGHRRETGTHEFIGIYDKEWEMADGIWHYLHFLRDQNREIWAELIGLDLPEEGSGFAADMAIIPEGGKEQFVPALSLADNLILSIPERAGRHGLISPTVRKAIAERFYSDTGISAQKQEVTDLDRLERRLFLLYRAFLKKPKMIILESPYTGLTSLQTEKLRSYMTGLARKGITIACFSRKPEELQRDCALILHAKNARGAKISTYSQFFPPQ